jgi:hypothetical protein
MEILKVTRLSIFGNTRGLALSDYSQFEALMSSFFLNRTDRTSTMSCWCQWSLAAREDLQPSTD